MGTVLLTPFVQSGAQSAFITRKNAVSAGRLFSEAGMNIRRHFTAASRKKDRAEDPCGLRRGLAPTRGFEPPACRSGVQRQGSPPLFPGLM